MPFFEPPPPPPDLPEPEPYFPEPWEGRPPNVLGMPVGERIVLVQRADLLVAVVGIIAFPAGVEFTVVFKSPSSEMDDAFMEAIHGAHAFGRPGRRRGEDAAAAARRVFRLGVVFADGARAADRGPGFFGPMESKPAPPVLLEAGGGGGGGGSWSKSYWLWPLPPEGPLTFVCQWQAMGVEETVVSVDAAPIRAAAAQALTLWEAPPSKLPRGAAAFAIQRRRARSDVPRPPEP